MRTEVTRVLADMAQGTRFDVYWNRTVVMLFDALKNVRGALPANYVPSDLARLSEAVLVAGADHHAVVCAAAERVPRLAAAPSGGRPA